jgi:hypothetical protein
MQLQLRSVWRADIELLDWKPKFEIAYRKLLDPCDACNFTPTAYAPLWVRAFHEAFDYQATGRRRPG